MTIQDTYKYGSLYVDADMTITCLDDDGLITPQRREVLELFKDSGIDFTFDDDWSYGSFYAVDGQETPLILLGWFGGYPGDSIDDANAQAAKEWAEGRDYIFAFSQWFGGCESVQLYLNWDDCTVEEAEEAVELVEHFADYPVLDEDLWSQIQTERWYEMIDEMVVSEENERDIVFTEDQREYINEATQNYYGYWEEGWFPQEEWDGIVAEALAKESGTVKQLHQETKLW